MAANRRERELSSLADSSRCNIVAALFFSYIFWCVYTRLLHSIYSPPSTTRNSTYYPLRVRSIGYHPYAIVCIDV